MSLLSVNKKGKWVVGGVIAFALIATASTGLAAWIVGTQTGANTNGNISVDADVVDNQVSLTVYDEENGSDLSVYFGPTEAGGAVVKPSGVEGEKYEDLDFTIAGRANFNVANLDMQSIRVRMYVTESISSYVGSYIDYPDGGTYVASSSYNDDNRRDGTSGYYEYTVDETFTADGDGGEKFSLKFEFKWGSEFGGRNPCAYYTEASQSNAALTALKELAKISATTFYVDLLANCVSVNQ